MPPNKTPKPIRPFAVALQISQTVNFFVDARTPEEAEVIATDWLEDGETGEITEQVILDCDCYPTEDDTLDSPVNRSKPFPRNIITDLDS